MQKTDTIAFAGNWHGADDWAAYCIDGLARDHDVRFILHVGDFGIWPGFEGQQYIDIVEAACAKQDTSIWITPGNHEHWSRLDEYWSQHPDVPLELSEHIQVLPRGYRLDLTTSDDSEISFVSLGGAPSIDYTMRSESKSWWPGEMIQPEHVDQVVNDGYADVMITHDAPDAPFTTPAVQHILAKPGGWPPEGVTWARIGRNRMTNAVLGVKPRLLVHGHYHVDDDTVVELPETNYTTTIWSLACDGMRGNVRLLDLKHFSNLNN